MFEAIVTFVKTEPDDITRAEMDSRIAAGESIEHATTWVYRLEFETEENFELWMTWSKMGSVVLNVELLTKKFDVREA